MYVLCLLFNHVFYIYPRTFCMIQITWFQVHCTKILRPPLKGDNGWLVVVVIALLVVVWLITPRIASSMVRIMKQEHKINNTLLQCSNILASSIFIELFDSSSSDNFTPLPSLTKTSKGIPQFGALLSSQPSNPIGSIQ